VSFPLRFGAVYGALKEARTTSRRPLLVAGVLADELARELAAGGDETAVRTGGAPEDVEALLYVIGDTVTEADERVLKLAHRSRVPVIVVAAGRVVPLRIPFVPATDVVRVEPGHGFPIDEIAAALADRLDERAASLARRLPALRAATCERMIKTFSFKNGLIGAAVFIPGVDLPVLTLNQIRMVLRICAAHGLEVDAQRAPELLATVAAGFGFRTLARELLDVVPVLGWAIKGGVAYGGTRAVGEAAVRYCDARTSAQAGLSLN
jgi:uncharacterized protein (DUF697 family)